MLACWILGSQALNDSIKRALHQMPTCIGVTEFCKLCAFFLSNKHFWLWCAKSKNKKNEKEKGVQAKKKIPPDFVLWGPISKSVNCARNYKKSKVKSESKNCLDCRERPIFGCIKEQLNFLLMEIRVQNMFSRHGKTWILFRRSRNHNMTIAKLRLYSVHKSSCGEIFWALGITNSGYQNHR